MDSILQQLLNSADEAQREHLLSELILLQAAPLVRKVLRQRLGFYVSRSGNNSHNPDAEDLFHEIITKLIQRLNELTADSDENPINNYRQFVLSTAVNACHDYLRAKSPARARVSISARIPVASHLYTAARFSHYSLALKARSFSVALHRTYR